MLNLNIQLPTALLLVSLIGAIGVFVYPDDTYLGKVKVGVAPLALLVALAQVGIWIFALHRFDFSRPNAVQMEQQHVWFKDLGVSFDVGFSAVGLWLSGLAVVVMTVAIGYAWWSGRERPNGYFALMTLLTGAIVGVFIAQDLLLFYAFFEAMLIPLYVLVGVWGGANRGRATLKFVIYTMVGSLLMLAAILIYGINAHSFAMAQNDSTTLHLSNSTWLFLAFMLAFAIKAPLIPFHGWLPEAYRESPAEVSAVLSGVVSKAAAWGFLRIALELFPGPANNLRTPILIVAAAGLVYGSLCAFRAPDFRGVVAYSSLAQMGLITLGIFAQTGIGWSGASLQMVNHGLVSASLFLLAGFVEARTGTGTFSSLGGMSRGRPRLATIVLLVGMIALAVPLSSAFAGEFLILTGVFKRGWGFAVVGAIAIVLAAMYMLRAISAILHRDVGSAVSADAPDLRLTELGIVVPLVGCLLALSVWPNAISGHSFAPVGTPGQAGASVQEGTFSLAPTVGPPPTTSSGSSTP
jgi:NADH-quinone oxidoreductase subunit M